MIIASTLNQISGWTLKADWLKLVIVIMDVRIISMDFHPTVSAKLWFYFTFDQETMVILVLKELMSSL